MSGNKTHLAVGLILAGALIGAFAGMAIAFGNQSLVVWVIGSAAVICVMLGSVLAMSTVLDHTTQPVMETLGDGLADDMENLQQGIMTWPIWQFILTLASAIVYFMLLLRYHKFEAMWWGWMPVWFLSALAAGLLVLLYVTWK